METDEVETDDMEIDEIVDVDMETNDLGVEDYGRLISSNAISSFLCSKKFMTLVSHQLDIESCISFTLGASLGALVVLDQPHTRDVPEFSKQDMVDCLPIESIGTTFEHGYNYVRTSGLHLEEDYPYVNDYGVCRCSEIRGRPKHSISRYTFIHRQEEVLEALRRHPLTAGIYLFESFELHCAPYRSRADLLEAKGAALGDI